jgi:DNA polymerase lambda
LKEGKLLPFDEYAAKPLMDTLVEQQGSTSSQLPPLSSQPSSSASETNSSRLPTQGYRAAPSQPASPPQEPGQEGTTYESQIDLSAPSQTESHDADKTNRNKHITDILDELQAMYLQMGDQFRAQNYKKSSNQLKRMRHIQSASELDGITGFGKSLKTTIQEILNTGSLKKLSHLKKNPRSTAITLLSDVWGVGEKTAEQLYNQGYHTIEDLRSRGKQLLNRQQLIGLAHYEEFLTRIPREEVEFIGQIVEEECRR